MINTCHAGFTDRVVGVNNSTPAVFNGVDSVAQKALKLLTIIGLTTTIIAYVLQKTAWLNEPSDEENVIPIISKREPEVPGTHIIHYISDIDEIEIKHTAKSRTSFALGAVLVAEWILDKKGVLSMKDFMKF